MQHLQQVTRTFSHMQVAVFLFNEPLLWCTFYAPAQIFKLISVAMQLTFIAVMLSYWLVEFGLLKSNQQASGH